MSDVIAVLGLGEAGSLIARDLVAAGAVVRGYDPAVSAPEGITDTGSEAEAAAGAGLVLSVNSAKAAVGALGADIEVLDGPAGLAACRKLLRSVFYKGMAASIVEALEAARAAGYEDWLREHIAEELVKADSSTVDRIVTGTRRHAIRRGAEMEAAARMLTELGVDPLMADASRALHERVATRRSG